MTRQHKATRNSTRHTDSITQHDTTQDKNRTTRPQDKNRTAIVDNKVFGLVLDKAVTQKRINSYFFHVDMAFNSG